jgi:hypothetical protein
MGKIIYSLVLVKKDSEKFIKLLSSLKGILGVDLSVVFFGEIMAVVSDIKKKVLFQTNQMLLSMPR